MFDHEANFKEYNKLINEALGNSLNKNTLRSLEAQHSISSAYGLIKLHKPSKKLRPIVTGYNSMVANAHEYIKNLISPIAKNCSFLVEDPKTFKERFLKDIDKFDNNLHEIVTFDATSLYTSINTNRVISEILKIIYKNPDKFLKDKDQNGRPWPFLDRANFLKF